jgi:hypothetical protein
MVSLWYNQPPESPVENSMGRKMWVFPMPDAWGHAAQCGREFKVMIVSAIFQIICGGLRPNKF